MHFMNDEWEKGVENKALDTDQHPTFFFRLGAQRKKNGNHGQAAVISSQPSVATCNTFECHKNRQNAFVIALSSKLKSVLQFNSKHRLKQIYCDISNNHLVDSSYNFFPAPSAYH